MTPSCSSSAPIWREIADWLSFSAFAGMSETARIRHCLEDPQLVPVHDIASLASRAPAAAYSAACAMRASCPASHFSASSAAMQPVPAAVTAWRKILSCTSPAA